MKRTCPIVAVIAMLLVGWARADGDPSLVGFYGETACQNLPGADFRPGALKLPLVVQERSGVARSGAIVTSGVPFPPGFLPDVSKLRVVDKDGRPVICQAAVMTRWWKPAYDDSVQWALVSLLADVPAEATATYYLTDDGQAAAPASPLKVTRTQSRIEIDTGAATFAIPLAGEALLSNATVGGREILGPGGLRGTAVAGDWPDRGLKAGDRMAATHEAAGVTVEESGPARVVVRIQGSYAPGDKEHKFYTFTARLTFAANDPSVRLVYILENTRLDAKLYDGEKGKSRFAWIWPLQDVSLVADLAAGGGASASTVVDGKTVSAQVGNESLAVHQTKLASFDVSVGGRQQATGKEHAGVIDLLQQAGRGLAVARRYFHSEWPGVLAASATELRIGLLPGESGENLKYHFNVGQRKSWDVLLAFHGPRAPDLSNLAAEQETKLMFRPLPAWMVRAAGVTGSWSAGLHLEEAPAKVALRRTVDNLELPYGGRFADTRITSGGDHFGVISAWNAGGGHWNENSAFWRWVLFGDGGEFDSSEARTLWAADLCPIQFDTSDIGAFGSYIYYGRFNLARIQVLTYPGYVNRHTDYPDTGHMGMWMWHEYYLLTGDPRARDATCHLGNYARAYFWRYTHDGRRDGTGPEAGDGGYRKMDPDADPEFKLDRRYTGWPLYCLMQGYQFTGDPEVLAEGRLIARAFRNTARTSPIGQLVKDAASKTGGEDIDDKRTHSMEYATAIFAGVNGAASQLRDCRKSASLVSSNFYNAYVTAALREYYTWSRDVEALDTLVGEADHFCKHILIRNPQGKPAGWSYMFADYWGPYTWDDATADVKPFTDKMKTTPGVGFNAFVIDAVAGLYYLTNRPYVMEVCEEAAATNPYKSDLADMVNCLRMALTHPKADQTPPATIMDLKAELLDDGKIRLTWTAPGGDGGNGRAAWYQVKWSPASIVEITEGWPDRTEPLPATNKEWRARAAAFNARQRAFWAAFNLAGEPDPGPPGAAQSMTVEGIPAGKACLAIKAWDAANNASDLSNVVQVQVR
ncbi:MAG: hypothetical protein BIFFINMI_00891 [Phycisphaerae bacterium]|nr:hypothetical protein [Phycisphaerae bacterium]